MRKHTDNTERSQTEQMLARLKKIFDATPDIVATLRPDLRLMDLNESGRKLLGWSLDQYLPEKTLSAFFWPREYDRIVKEGIPLAIEREMWLTESTLFPASGIEVPVTLAILAHKSDNGELEYLTFIARDCTDIKRSQKRLYESEQRLLESQTIAHIGTFEFDLTNKKNDYWSDEMYRIFEIDQISAVPSYQDLIHLVHPEDREMVDEFFKVLIGKDHNFEITHRLLLEGEKVKHIRAVGKIYYDESNTPIRAVGTTQDISNTIILQQDLFLKSRAVESHIDAIAMATPDGNLVYVNQAFIDLWGEMRKEDVLGRSVTSFWEDPIEALDVIKKLRSKDLWVGEIKAKRRDRSTFDALLSASAILSPDGEINNLMASFIDITKQKRAQESLQKKEEEYRLLVENQEDVICRWLPDSTLTFVNQSYCMFFGKTREQLIGRKWLSFIPEIAQDEIKQYYLELAKNARSNRIEHQAISATGAPCWQEWVDTPIFDSKGGLLEFQSIGRDTTQRKELEQKVRDNSELFDKILETTSEAYLFFSKDRRILNVNEQACTMLGYTRAELLNLSISDIDALETEEDAKARFKCVSATGYEFFETRHRKKDGSIIDVEVRAIAWISKGDQKLAGFIRDITELKKVSEYKNELEVIKKSNRMMTEILGLFRHELLTPMHAILGFSQTLSNDTQLADRYREKAEVVSQSAARLAHTLKNIVSMADMDARHATMNTVAFDLYDLLEEIEDIFRPVCKSRGLGMVVELAPGTPWSVIGDRNKLSQIINNLIDNTLQSAAHSAITLRVWKDLEEQAFFEKEPLTRLLFEVEGGGAGIDTNLQRALSVSPLQDTSFDGLDQLGFGLLIAREYVKMMGGDLKVEHRPGTGSCFCFDVTLRTIDGSKLGDGRRRKCTQQTTGYAKTVTTSDLPVAEEVSALAEELRTNLRQAVEDGDMELFTELLEPVAESHSELVQKLRKLAGAFNYCHLNTLLTVKGMPDEK